MGNAHQQREGAKQYQDTFKMMGCHCCTVAHNRDTDLMNMHVLQPEVAIAQVEIQRENSRLSSRQTKAGKSQLQEEMIKADEIVKVQEAEIKILEAERITRKQGEISDELEKTRFELRVKAAEAEEQRIRLNAIAAEQIRIKSELEAEARRLAKVAIAAEKREAASVEITRLAAEEATSAELKRLAIEEAETAEVKRLSDEAAASAEVKRQAIEEASSAIAAEEATSNLMKKLAQETASLYLKKLTDKHGKISSEAQRTRLVKEAAATAEALRIRVEQEQAFEIQLQERSAAASKIEQILQKKRSQSKKLKKLLAQNIIRITKEQKIKKGKEVFQKAIKMWVIAHIYDCWEISDSEKNMFVKIVNNELKDDPDCKHKIPIALNNNDALVTAFNDGILMCKILLLINPDCIDERVIIKIDDEDAEDIQENIVMGIQAAQANNINMTAIHAIDFEEGNKVVVLHFLWHALKILAQKKINLSDMPEIYELRKNDETASQLRKLKEDNILVRWVNHNNGQISDLSGLADSQILMNVVDNINHTKSELTDQNYTKLIEQSNASLFSVEDLKSNSKKINILFAIQVFITNSGLNKPSEEELANINKSIDHDNREEETLSLWINSLGISGVQQQGDLCGDISDGIILCSIVHHMNKDVIKWKNIEMYPKNDFGKNGNCGQAIDGAKKMGLKMIGIGGNNIVKGDEKDIKSMIWSLMKHRLLSNVKGKSEKELIQWLNNRVKDQCPPITGFRDKSLSSGKFLLQVIKSIEEKYVKSKLVTEGSTDEEKKNNAKYGITLVRKLGGNIFCSWQDLVKVDSKQNLIMYATLQGIATYNEMEDKSELQL